MDTVKQQMSSDFAQLTKRSKEDPGTAGDQVEEDWATFLRDWLPATYPIVTKGRVINSEGVSSPQIDIVVLQPNYPKFLLRKKQYFAGGVVAAFECKLTLRQPGLKRFFENSCLLKKLTNPSTGNPYDELHQMPFYGLLAHSTAIRGQGKHDIYEKIFDCMENIPSHPRELPDLICINDTSTHIIEKRVLWKQFANEFSREVLEELGQPRGIGTFLLEECEFEQVDGCSQNSTGFNLAALIRRVTTYMSFHDPSIRPFSDYLESVGGHGGLGKWAFWKIESLSDEVRKTIAKKGFADQLWSKWSQDFEPL